MCTTSDTEALPDGISVNMDTPRRLNVNLPKNQSWTLRSVLGECLALASLPTYKE